MAFAVALAAFSTSSARADDGASKYVERLGDQALSIISNAKSDKAQKQSRLEKLFSDNVDIPWVARFVMGRFWRTATEPQKSKYVKEYQKFLLKHYTSRFSDYSSGGFKVTNSRDDGEGEYTVSMQIMAPDSKEPILVDYRVRKDGGSYKIFDVIVEGVSMITTQRSEFASVLNSEGIDSLIGKLGTMSAPDQPAKK